MNCREFVEFLDRYLDGLLPPDQAREFETHLAECDDCVAYLQNYRATVKLASGSAEPPLPLPAELIAAILSIRPDLRS